MQPLDQPPARNEQNGVWSEDSRPPENTSKSTRRGRRSRTVVAFAVCGALFVVCLVIRWSCTSRSPTQLDLLSTVRPDDAFWVSERIAGTHDCKTYVLPRDQGLALLSAVATVEPWEPNGAGLLGFRQGEVHPPSPKVMLVWCRDWKHRRGLRGNVLLIDADNEVVNYEGKAYVVPPEGREVFDRLFPDDRSQNVPIRKPSH